MDSHLPSGSQLWSRVLCDDYLEQVCGSLRVSVFPGRLLHLPRLASRVTLAVRADARDVIYLYIYLSPGTCTALSLRPGHVRATWGDHIRHQAPGYARSAAVFRRLIAPQPQLCTGRVGC